MYYKHTDKRLCALLTVVDLSYLALLPVEIVIQQLTAFASHYITIYQTLSNVSKDPKSLASMKFFLGDDVPILASEAFGALRSVSLVLVLEKFCRNLALFRIMPKMMSDRTYNHFF